MLNESQFNMNLGVVMLYFHTKKKFYWRNVGLPNPCADSAKSIRW